jgi:uncharacterized membrane protein YphA (DoxX/SURF4 family)
VVGLNNLKKSNLTSALLRAGLATIFLYAAISSLKNPQDWIGYIPAFVRERVQGNTLLHVFSAYELLLALWLLSGKYIKLAALAAACTLAGIVLFNFSLFAITFRDIALIFAALALVFAKD